MRYESHTPLQSLIFWFVSINFQITFLFELRIAELPRFVQKPFSPVMMKLWRGISAHALNKNGASIGGATPPQMSTNPYYLILQAEWGEPTALMGKPLSQSHISSCLYELLGLKVKRQPTIRGPPSFITLQHRELVQVGVGQFMKSSLPDT